MSNPNMEAKVRELMELKRMKEELEAEMCALEDEIKAVMGAEETLIAGVFKVNWKNVSSSRLDSTALKKSTAGYCRAVHEADRYAPVQHKLTATVTAKTSPFHPAGCSLGVLQAL